MTPGSRKFIGPLKAGDLAWLESNDCFGTREPVYIVKVHKAGTVTVTRNGKNYSTHLKNLTRRES